MEIIVLQKHIYGQSRLREKSQPVSGFRYPGLPKKGPFLQPTLPDTIFLGQTGLICCTVILDGIKRTMH